MPLNWVALIVFVLFFGLVTVLGFAAARWRRGDLDLLHEWGLAGNRFGTLVTWFLIGGDIYTAYTFVAVPALAFGAGAIAFFAVPYTILIYPFLFVVFPRLWAVAKKHGYITAPDFVRGRFGNRWLALAIGITGLVATMPYIALQLVGIQVVIGAMGIQSGGLSGDLPLINAFVILALFTYSSGLRAPAAIAIVKDLMIYITVLAAIIIIPIELGGYGKMFATAAQKPAPWALILPTPPAGSYGQYSNYATLAIGSALALFLYPHSITGILSSSSGHVVRRNAALLPAYSFMLGLLALLGIMAIAAGSDKVPELAPAFAEFKNNFAVPGLFLQMFPSWFVGFAFAAIAIGALVPAAIMSIAAANIWSRNIYREFIRPNCTPREEAQMAKWASLIVKFGALLFIIFLPLQYAIQLQLLGGVMIIQTLPAVIIGLYTRWFNSWGLLLGWACGLATGIWMASLTGFQNATYPLSIAGMTIPGYAALYTLIINIAVAAVATLVLNAIGSAERTDETIVTDYA
jgi:solute:Na+ symporter, SSS family